MFGRRYRDASEMIRSRWITDPWLAVTIRQPFRSRANAVIARSISPGLRVSIGVNPTPNDAGAIAWITANWPTCGIAKDRNSRQIGGNFFEQFEPFSA